MNKIVGKNVTSKKYWDKKTDSYLTSFEGPYHKHRLSVIENLLKNVDFKKKNILDFGCGDGSLLSKKFSKISKFIGIDINSKMIEVAKSKFKGRNIKFYKGDVNELSKVTSNSIDIFLALNVLAYFKDSEEKKFYRNLKRVLKKNGYFLVTHSNSCFDLFTLNKYTVDFFKINFNTNINKLLSSNTLPIRNSFNVRENPLNYYNKLKKYDLEEIEQGFINYHRIPPLLEKDKDFDDINSKNYENTNKFKQSERWKLFFQCSQFASLSKKIK